MEHQWKKIANFVRNTADLCRFNTAIPNYTVVEIQSSNSKYSRVLGTELTVQEVAGSSVYNGIWTRRPGTDIFDEAWGYVKDVIEITSVNGNEITLYRYGNKGYYYGNLSNDGSFISGNASWYESIWYWNATISN